MVNSVCRLEYSLPKIETLPQLWSLLSTYDAIYDEDLETGQPRIKVSKLCKGGMGKSETEKLSPEYSPQLRIPASPAFPL